VQEEEEDALEAALAAAGAWAGSWSGPRASLALHQLVCAVEDGSHGVVPLLADPRFRWVEQTKGCCFPTFFLLY
jgi:hypothetical protein